MEFRLLGALEIRDGERRIELRRPKQRALLATLLLNAGELVSTDRLIDSLWGESPPPRAIGSLQNLVSELRKEVGPDRLRTRAPGYLLDVERDAVDAHRFVRLVAEARDARDPAARRSLLRSALELWRGDALADVELEPFADVEAARLEEQRLVAREELVDAELRLGRHGSVLGEIEALTTEQPYRERPRALLMLALYRCGRQAEALDAYQQARSFLREELGLEPSPGLQELQRAMLRQDPALDAPATTLLPAAGEERRKTVTVVFADVVDSTTLGAELDAEAYRDVLRRWYRTARAALEAHGGAVEKFIGDAVVAVFGVPAQHEDDALRAVRAAVEVQERLVELNADLERTYRIGIRVRVGVNTGEAITGDAGAEGAAMGYAVNVAAKLQQAAEAGTVLIGPATYRLVRAAVAAEAAERLSLGRRDVPTFRVVSLVRDARGVARNLGAPIVGRERELAALRSAWTDARDSGAYRAVTVFGEAGIGKSRLAAELAAAVADEATVLAGHCLSYGEGTAYLPIAQIVRTLVPDGSESGMAALLGDADDARAVARRVRELLGWAESVSSSSEGVWAIRRLLEAIAQAKPLLLVLDDVHWAAPALLELLEQVGAQPPSAPVLLVCLAREDLRESQPASPGALTLAPLEPAEAAQLVANLPGSAEVLAETRRRIVDAAEGNALFAEQLLAYALEGGENALDTVPATIEALLASRLDHLPEPERAVIDRAAVVGREFWRGAVAELSERVVDEQLAALAAKGLVEASRTLLPGEDALRFHHALIRDVAYAAITKERRSKLHERVARWLEARDPGADEVIGYHLEQAVRYRREFGDEAVELAAAAGDRLAAAGIRAWKQANAAEAAGLLRRACALLPQAALRADLLCELALASRAAGDATEADAALAAAGDTPRARLERAHAALYAGGGGSVGAVLAAAATVLTARDADERSLGRACTLVADAHWLAGHYDAAATAARDAAAHAAAAGWSASNALTTQAAALYYGTTPVDQAVREARRLLPEVETDRLAHATVVMIVAALEALRERFAIAQRLASEARSGFDELGQRRSLATIWAPFRALVERLAGNDATAATLLRESCDLLEEMHERAHLATHAAELADVLITLDQVEEAHRYADLSRRLAPAEDIASQFAWRSALARIEARREAYAAAEELAFAALELVDATHAPVQAAWVRLALADVLRKAGRTSEASRAALEAVALARQKGASALASLAERLAAETASVA